MPGVRGVPIKNVIQTDAAINPGRALLLPVFHLPSLASLLPKNTITEISMPLLAGNSGGVLLDSRGRLIGINSAIADPTGMARDTF